MTTVHDERRLARLLPELIERLGLDLTGLTVLTEAASGPYLAAPMIAALAGAARVDAIAADNRFHRADDVEAATMATAGRLGVPDTIRILRGKDSQAVAEADIVTNSGSVRPIDSAMIEALKPTAVVPLMWETWEFVPEQLDLDACRNRGILVLGTVEREDPCNLVPYSGLTAARLLFALGLEVVRTRVLLLGLQPGLGTEMQRFLTEEYAEVTAFSRPGDGGRPYEEVADHFAEYGARYDALLVAEHMERGLLVGPGGHLEPELIARVNPALRVGVVCGAVDADALRRQDLLVEPQNVAPVPIMSFQPGDLGPRPVLELYTAGLRVGEVAARARLSGLSVQEAARAALRDAPAMDFPDQPFA